LLQTDWAAYRVGREKTDELGGFFYDGKGGLDLSPPLSWIFDFTFFLAYRDQTIRVLRYKDVYDRIKLLFPYFVYEFEGKRVDMFPVTDGQRTYYMMPLIVCLETRNVPWSAGNPVMRLVGYAMIDVYDGSIQLFILGQDYFSELFKTVYSDYVATEVPSWLEKQMRYPEELFEWRIGMFSHFYTITSDPTMWAKIFIEAKEFLVVPEGLDTTTSWLSLQALINLSSWVSSRLSVEGLLRRTWRAT